jgi:hypothetical protein
MNRRDRKKSKPITDEGHSDPDKARKEQYERHVDGSIRVTGEIEVHLPPDAGKQETPEQKKARSYRFLNFVVSTLTLLAVIIYAGLTAWQGCSSKKAADAAASAAKTANDTLQLTLAVNRPSVTVSAIPVRINKKTGEMEFAVAMQNGSEIEAASFAARCELFFDNKPSAGQDRTIPANPMPLGAHTVATICGGHLPPDVAKQLVQQTSIFDLYTHATYEGIGGKSYSYCTKHRYDPTRNGFWDLGVCDPSKPFPQ